MHKLCKRRKFSTFGRQGEGQQLNLSRVKRQSSNCLASDAFLTGRCNADALNRSHSFHSALGICADTCSRSAVPNGPGVDVGLDCDFGLRVGGNASLSVSTTAIKDTAAPPPTRATSTSSAQPTRSPTFSCGVRRSFHISVGEQNKTPVLASRTLPDQVRATRPARCSRALRVLRGQLAHDATEQTLPRAEGSSNASYADGKGGAHPYTCRQRWLRAIVPSFDRHCGD